MNNQHHRRNSSGDDNFSFPTIQAAEAHHSFEFGSTTTPPTRPIPADRLFSNGKLLPHSFPFQPAGAAIHTTAVVHLSRSTSVTSNRDSLLSSRSNSASSSSNRSCGSGCSSARTSISESSWASTAAERKLFSQHAAKKAAAAAARGDEYNIWSQYQAKSKPVLKPHYSSSRRWQFIALAPGPGLRHQNSASRSRKVQCFEEREENDEKEKKKPAAGGSLSSLFRRRFFRWIVSSCRGCHAMNPPPVKDLTANT